MYWLVSLDRFRQTGKKLGQNSRIIYHTQTLFFDGELTEKKGYWTAQKMRVSLQGMFTALRTHDLSMYFIQVYFRFREYSI